MKACGIFMELFLVGVVIAIAAFTLPKLSGGLFYTLALLDAEAVACLSYFAYSIWKMRL